MLQTVWPISGRAVRALPSDSYLLGSNTGLGVDVRRESILNPRFWSNGRYVLSGVYMGPRANESRAKLYYRLNVFYVT